MPPGIYAAASYCVGIVVETPGGQYTSNDRVEDVFKFAFWL